MEQDIATVIESGTKWLLNQQHDDGGWGERFGQKSNVLNTAEVLISLMDAGCINREKINPGDKRINKAVKFLLSNQDADGCWNRTVIDDNNAKKLIPDIIRTSFIIRALIKSGVSVNEKPIEDSINWVIKMKNKNGGWGYKQNDEPSLMPTCLILLSFLDLFRASGKEELFKNIIEDGLKLLLIWQNEVEGYFGDKDYLKGIYTINAILVLQSARRSELRPYLNQERKAIEWLLVNRDQALMLAEEEIRIDPTEQHNYGYLFMNDSLLLTVLMGSEQSDKFEKKVIIETMLSIKRKKDRSGGFHGYRVFSWSTAKAISALNSAVGNYKAFPESEPVYKGYKVGNAILLLVVLIFIVASILIATKSLEQWHAIFFLILTLPVLLAYKLIGEKTFTELFKFSLNKGINKEQDNEKK